MRTKLNPALLVGLAGLFSLAAACGEGSSGVGGSSSAGDGGSDSSGDGGSAGSTNTPTTPSSSAATNPQGSSSSGTNPQGTGGDNPQGTGGDNPQGTGGDNPQGTGGDNPQGTGGAGGDGSGGEGTGGDLGSGGEGGGTNYEPVDCTDAPELVLGTNNGTFVGAEDRFSPGVFENGCTGYVGNGVDVVYAIDLEADQTLTVEIDAVPDADVNLYLIADCADSVATCLDGVDSTLPGGETLVARVLEAGTYFLIVDQYLFANEESIFAPFTLDVSVAASTPCPEHECPTGQCIDDDFLCDEDLDCADNSDEAPVNEECQ